MINRAYLEKLARHASDKRFARHQVRDALKKGTLKKEPCMCGDIEVEAHHPDYSKPLEVIWACKKHHVELDKMRREDEGLNGIRTSFPQK